MSTDEPPSDARCGWYWGSHGCDLAAGHDGACVCDDCSQFDHAMSKVRYLTDDGWSEWLDSKAFR